MMRQMAKLPPRPTRRGRFTIYGLLVAFATVIALLASTATAGATEASITDAKGNTMTAIERDTVINWVPPLDGNPLTREWFHDGVAGYAISGPDAEGWSGTIKIGYQVGYPATFNGQITFNYSTPSLGIDLSDGGITLGNLIPTLGVQLSVGFGPGIQNVDIASAAVSGADGYVGVRGFHGSVTGVVGQTSIRPYVTLISSATGDTVTTYGDIWRN